MKLNILLLAAALFSSPLVSTAVAQPATATRSNEPSELASFKKSIRVQYDLKERAWSAGDYKAIVNGFYAKDAFTASEGDPKAFPTGTAEFLNLYKTYVADATKVRIESVRTHVNGNMGWDWTNFYVDVKPEKVKEYPTSPVRILFLWEKVNGKWMCTGDVVLFGKFERAPTK